MEPKVIICGTGRAGTTLLMRIFTVAGLDTGYSKQDISNVEKNIGKAGLERVPNKNNFKNLPKIIKSPIIVNKLPSILSKGWFPIELAIIPVRRLEDAAQSRINVHNRAMSSGINPKRAPGGLWKTNQAENQHWVLSEQLYRTIQPLVEFDIPIILVSFPRFANDYDYFDKKISLPLSERIGWCRETINQAYLSECKTDLITVKDS